MTTNTPALTLTEAENKLLLAEEGRRVGEALLNLGFSEPTADRNLYSAITMNMCECLDHEELSEFCEKIEAARREAYEEDRIDALLRAIETIPNREGYGGGMRDFIKDNITKALWEGRLGGDRPGAGKA